MISTERNRRLWQACGWTRPVETSSSPYRNWWLPPTGDAQPDLPSPSDPVSFTGHMLRDGLPKVKDCEVTIALKDNGKAVCEIAFDDPLLETIHEEATTIWEAMFNAFEKALGLDKETA